MTLVTGDQISNFNDLNGNTPEEFSKTSIRFSRDNIADPELASSITLEDMQNVVADFQREYNGNIPLSFTVSESIEVELRERAKMDSSSIGETLDGYGKVSGAYWPSSQRISIYRDSIISQNPFQVEQSQLPSQEPNIDSVERSYTSQLSSESLGTQDEPTGAVGSPVSAAQFQLSESQRHSQRAIQEVERDNRRQEGAEDALRNEIAKTISYELVGHYGLNTLPPLDKYDLLQGIIRFKHEPGLKRIWSEVERNYKELTPLMQAEEVFALAAEKGITTPIWKEHLSVLKAHMRNAGLVSDSISQAELETLASSISRGIRNATISQQNSPSNNASQFEPTITGITQGEVNTKGMPLKQARAAAASMLRRYKGRVGANLEVVSTQSALESIFGTQFDSTVHALYHDGSIYLVAENIPDAATLRQKVRHELIGHFALEQLLSPSEYNRIRTTVEQGRNSKYLKPIWDRVLQNYGNEPSQVQIEEVIAHAAELERGQLGQWLDRVIAAVARALRGIGLMSSSDVTKSELNLIVQTLSDKVARHSEKATSRALNNEQSSEIRFSRENQDYQESASFIQSSLQTVRNLSASKILKGLKAKTRPFAMGMLTNLQLSETYQKVTGNRDYIGSYQGLLSKLEASRNEIIHRAEVEMDAQWDQLNNRDKKRLSQLMHDSTMLGIHPDEALIRQNLYTNLMDRLDGVADEGDLTAIANLQEEVSAMEQAHQELNRSYDLLDENAKKLYQDTKQFYLDNWEQLKRAIEGRIEDMGGNAEEQAALRDKIRLQFENAISKGPYFPLSRFGDYVVRAFKDDDYMRYHFESESEAQAFIEKNGAELELDGYQLTLSKKESFNSTDLKAIQRMGTEVLRTIGVNVDEQGNVDPSALTDDIWQLLLNMLPEASYGRRAIHRKRIKGATTDMRRAFADSATSFAFHISRINYGHLMQDQLDQMRGEIEKGEKGQESAIAQDDLIIARELLNEMEQRHDLTMNPRGKAWASWAGNLGFIMYLGASPAAGLVNLTQTPLVALPQIASRYGWSKAMREVGRAAAQYVKSANSGAFQSGTREAWVSLSRWDGIPQRERDMLKQAHQEGWLDLTQAHALMQTSDTDTQHRFKPKPLIAQANRWIGSIFHNAEVMNREVVALAEYRLVKENQPQLSDEQVMAKVKKAVEDGHFNYSSTNRPRLMRSDFAKVLLQFKQYSQHMVYNLATGANATIKDMTKALTGKERIEEEKRLRRQFVGMMGMHFLAAGSLGLPLASVVFGSIDWVFGTDDEPYDSKTEFQNWLAGTFGSNTANFVTRGVVDTATGLNLSSRVSLDNLVYRSPSRELEPNEMGAYVLEQVAGPVFGGLGVGSFTAMGDIANGELQRGFEKLSPKFIRDYMKAYRYYNEGELTRRGDEVIARDEFSAFELAGQAIGLSPARVSVAYDARRSIKNMESALTSRRSELMKSYSRAFFERDQKQLSDSLQQIIHWNTLNPRLAITNKSIRQSLKATQRNRTQTTRGVYLPESRSWMREFGRFAE